MNIRIKELKMIDERKVNSKLETAKYKMKKKIEEINGKNSRRTRNLVKKLRQEAAKSKSTIMKKYEQKLKHLRRKFRTSEEDKINKVPDSIADLKLENLSVFNKKKFDDIEIVEYETEVIGDIVLTDNERKILRLPPKFSIEDNLPPEGLALEVEMANAKCRMTIRKEEEEKLEEDEGIAEIEEDESFQEELEKQDAQSRQIYDPTTRTFNDAKRRATDLKECSRITLPKPLETRHEAMIETRRNMNEKTYNQYRDEECNRKGEVKGNLTEEEKDGLKSLQNRIKNKEIIILKTDKSGKLCVTTREEYERMGHEHIKKDVEIGRKQIIEMEKQLNGHVFFWAKIWGSGEARGHKDRIIDSKVVSSEQLADLYLTYKDHKEGRKTRPVVTGCSSNSMGFSNSVSDLLESVNKANEDPYECISSEDMLANTEKFNTEARKIMEEGRKHLMRKINCEKERGMKNISRCDKLWKKKSGEARMAASQEEHDIANDTGERAGEEENLDELRLREIDGQQQHTINPPISPPRKVLKPLPGLG